jgi:hypothetical protein
MIVAESLPLGRIVIQLGHAAHRRQLRLAAELAHLLSSTLHGLFIENEEALAVAGLSFARELRLPGHHWQPLDADQLIAEFRDRAALAQRLLDEAVRGLDVAGVFEVVRGEPTASLSAFVSESAVVVIAEPQLSSEHIGGMYSRMRAVVCRSASSILLVRRLPRRGADPSSWCLQMRAIQAWRLPFAWREWPARTS